MVNLKSSHEPNGISTRSEWLFVRLDNISPNTKFQKICCQKVDVKNDVTTF